MEDKFYKVKIDKEVLTDFFLAKDVTKEHIKEVKKVFNVVMIKHFSKFMEDGENLFQYAMLAILERRTSYNTTFSAYNYIYTCFRNEIGNKINKLTKELLVEDILTFKELSQSEAQDILPPEVVKYQQALLGLEDFIYKRIPRGDVLDLILYFRLHESRRDVKIPSFLEGHKKAIPALYKLLKEMTEL